MKTEIIIITTQENKDALLLKILTFIQWKQKGDYTKELRSIINYPKI